MCNDMSSVQFNLSATYLFFRTGRFFVRCMLLFLKQNYYSITYSFNAILFCNIYCCIIYITNIWKEWQSKKIKLIITFVRFVRNNHNVSETDYVICMWIGVALLRMALTDLSLIYSLWLVDFFKHILNIFSNRYTINFIRLHKHLYD